VAAPLVLTATVTELETAVPDKESDLPPTVRDGHYSLGDAIQRNWILWDLASMHEASLAEDACTQKETSYGGRLFEQP